MSSSSPLPSSVQPSARRHRAKACLVNGTLAAALVSVSVSGLATSASAAIVEPADWPSPFAVTIFPERDFVSVNWDGSGKALTFDLVRNGVSGWPSSWASWMNVAPTVTGKGAAGA